MVLYSVGRPVVNGGHTPVISCNVKTKQSNEVTASPASAHARCNATKQRREVFGSAMKSSTGVVTAVKHMYAQHYLLPPTSHVGSAKH